MSQLLAAGGRRLSGEVTIQGAKNSVLPILAATLLTADTVVLRRCPRLKDVEASIRILEALGCTARWQDDALVVDTAGMNGCAIPDALMREMRSSVIFLGAILARCGQAALSSPGGCELGPRPIDLHLTGLRALGAEIIDEGGTLRCQAETLTGRELVLGFPSVGATENLMLAACGAEGVTILTNAAREPEIEDLQNFLTVCGADITGAGTSTIRIRGRRPLHGGTYTVMPDRIATVTYMAAAAVTGGNVTLRDVDNTHILPMLAPFEQAGCSVRQLGRALNIMAPPRLDAVRHIRTMPYPGFPTDAQAPVMAALLRAQGVTVFEETVFADRYRHVPALRALGGRIQVSGAIAAVTGVPELHGAAMEATDLRGGAAMVVGALGAQGTSRIGSVQHILRGYEDFARRLAALGATIRMEHERAECCHGGLYYGLGRTGEGAQEKAP